MRFLMLLILLLPNMSAGQSTLENVITTSWHEDSFIRAQEAKISAADLDKYARFLPNNPNLTYSNADNSSWHIFGGSLDVGIPGKAFALSKLDDTRFGIEKSELMAKKNELAQYILNRYSECASGQELNQILSVATRELETLSKTLTARYEIGQSTQAERIGMELQYRQANIEYNAIRDRSVIACEKFKEVLDKYGMDSKLAESNLTLPDDLPEALVSEMGPHSIDFIRASNDARLSDVRYKTAAWEILPTINFGYYRQYYSQVVASPIIPTQWTTTYSVSVNFPLFYPFYNGNDLRKIRAENMIAERRAEMRKIESEVDMDNARKSFQRNQKILQKLRQHDLPMAETMVESTLANYKAGKLGFSELILAKRTWLDLKKEEVSLKQSLLNSRLVCLNKCEAESL